jgi:hypothetical protein
MKRIIQNRNYDTETATLLGVDGGGDGFRSWHEELYRKRNGEFFLYGQGGPMTRYAHACDSGAWTDGEAITPLTPEAARQWAEEHLDADDYEELFGDPGEGDEKVTLSLQIPAQLDAVIRRQAAEKRITLTAYITQILEASAK